MNVRKLSGATANRYQSFLSKVFQAAMPDYAETNPTRDVKKAKEQARPVPFLSFDDCQRIEAHAPAGVRPFLAVLSETGLRRGEAAALEWQDVDLERRRLVVRRSKNAKVRVVGLTARALAALEAVRSAPPTPIRGAARVFAGVNHDGVTRGFPGWATDAGLQPGLRLHDLRHGWA